MKIITITLNPAFDVHYNVENMQLYKENYATSVIKHSGGKGVNISRALSHFGVENTALCVLGTKGGDEFLSSVRADGVVCEPVMAEGRIRENITLHSKAGETRISCEGFGINRDILDSLYNMIQNQACEDMTVTFTGRLCEGITKEDAVDFLLNIKKLGAKVIVDCNSFGTDELFKIKPFLIKPNEQEISQLLGCEIKTQDDALGVLKSFYNAGVENVMVSLGAQGFVFCNKCGCFTVNVPKITPVSTIGAGDSTIAGFVYGLSQGLDIIEILKLAAAFGTAACLTEGTNPPDKVTINKLKDNIKIKYLEE